MLHILDDVRQIEVPDGWISKFLVPAKPVYLVALVPELVGVVLLVGAIKAQRAKW
jgi:hypothetical protein